MRYTILIVTLVFLGCARSLPPLRQGLARLTPARPQPPLSAIDSLLSLALEQAVIHGVADFPPHSREVIIRNSPFASAHVLPRMDSVTFYIVDSAQIQTLADRDRKSTRLNSSHGYISYAVFCLKKKKTTKLPVH